MSSSSVDHTPKEVTPVNKMPEEVANEEEVVVVKDDNEVVKNEAEIANKENALPWDHVDHEIGVKSFSGYTVKLNGWIRRDVREERQRAEREQVEMEQGEKEAVDTTPVDQESTAAASTGENAAVDTTPAST